MSSPKTQPVRPSSRVRRSSRASRRLARVAVTLPQSGRRDVGPLRLPLPPALATARLALPRLADRLAPALGPALPLRLAHRLRPFDRLDHAQRHPVDLPGLFGAGHE